MKKNVKVVLALVAVLLFSGFAFAEECAVIDPAEGSFFSTRPYQTVKYMTRGYGDDGYNYQAHMFNGDYYGDGSHLIMKWNDAWLSNKDCDNNGALDRPYDESGKEYYYGSGAWLTNHFTWDVDVNGKSRKASEFIKITSVPEDSIKKLVNNKAYFFTPGDTLIGEVIWGQFAIIEHVLNDPSNGANGVQFHSPAGPGFGHIDQ